MNAINRASRSLIRTRGTHGSGMGAEGVVFRAASSSAEAPRRQKHRIPKKRASALLAALQQETFAEIKGNREWPSFRSGDAIEVKRLPHVGSTAPETLKGVVIAMNSKGADTSVTIANSEDGSPVVRQIKIYNPLISDVKVLEKAFIHGGKKRVRRSKLYYLLERDPQEYMVR